MLFECNGSVTNFISIEQNPFHPVHRRRVCLTERERKRERGRLQSALALSHQPHQSQSLTIVALPPPPAYSSVPAVPAVFRRCRWRRIPFCFTSPLRGRFG
ncbi:hypothetical protein J6590_041045 [Homalodisca vitripennis]|nr:hypothetical protein J6590_041045 [Homalodisca vitripennis]